jgi:hypothetical protein
MTPDAPNPASAAARTGSGDAVCLSSSGQISSLAQRPAQAENDPWLITCASMRMDELRGCLIREISRTIAIGLQVQASLLDGDDDAALENLRRHWRVIRASITPLAAELRDLAGGRP